MKRLVTTVAMLCCAAWSGLTGVAHADAPTAVNLTSSSCPTLVKQGESDGCVTELQNLLIRRGMRITADGIFGQATLTAVEAFQSSAGLAADGEVGPNTKNALYHSPIVPTDCVLLQGATGCATGDGVAARAAAYAQWLSGAAGSDAQAADQQQVFGGSFHGANFDSLADIPYVWGGGHSGRPGPSTGTCDHYTGAISPCPANTTVGLDCSGFVRWLYQLAAGIDLAPTGGTEQEISSPYLHAVTRDQLRPGDLIFWGDGVQRTDHVAVFMGNRAVTSPDNSTSPLSPYSPPRTGTGPAVMEAWFTGSNIGYHLLSWHSTNVVGYYHVTGAPTNRVAD